MGHDHGSIASVVLLAALASSGGCSTGDLSSKCTPGRQIACACALGGEGYKMCREDGASYGACLGCSGDGTADGGGPSDAAEPDAATPLTDSGEPDAGVSEVDASAATDGGPPSFAWAWVDRGGPAFEPHACRPGAGVVDGALVDPMAFFSELVSGRDPSTWVTVMNEIEPELWSCGVGQQRSSLGEVRGRLFLPTASCPDASPPPDDPTAMHLGVRQEPDCWSHAVDVVSEM